MSVLIKFSQPTVCGGNVKETVTVYLSPLKETWYSLTHPIPESAVSTHSRIDQIGPELQILGLDFNASLINTSSLR